MAKTSKTHKTPKTPTAQVAGRLVVLAVLGALGVLGAAAMSMHQQLLLLCVRHAPPALPYDAEVEYLESTGTQWIDTGIFPRSGLLVRAEVVFGIGYVFGTLSGRTYLSVTRRTNDGIVSASAWSANASLNDLDVDLTKKYLIEINTANGSKNVSVDGSIRHTWATTSTVIGAYTIGLFAYRNANVPSQNSFGESKVSAFSVSDTATGEVLLDLIPVRKDGVGYMYDKVSGTLLGNSGTGAFVVGPDK